MITFIKNQHTCMRKTTYAGDQTYTVSLSSQMLYAGGVMCLKLGHSVFHK